MSTWRHPNGGESYLIHAPFDTGKVLTCRANDLPRSRQHVRATTPVSNRGERRFPGRLLPGANDLSFARTVRDLEPELLAEPRLELRGPDKLACEGEIPAFEAIRQKGPFGIGPELATRVGDV